MNMVWTYSWTCGKLGLPSGTAEKNYHLQIASSHPHDATAICDWVFKRAKLDSGLKEGVVTYSRSLPSITLTLVNHRIFAIMHMEVGTFFRVHYAAPDVGCAAVQKDELGWLHVPHKEHVMDFELDS